MPWNLLAVINQEQPNSSPLIDQLYTAECVVSRLLPIEQEALIIYPDRIKCCAYCCKGVAFRCCATVGATVFVAALPSDSSRKFNQSGFLKI
jgi:hypothetical protein